MTLSFADFVLRRIVCEARYSEAFPMWDRSGEVTSELRASFTNFKLKDANPASITLESSEGTMGVELTRSHISTELPKKDLVKFADSCDRLFGIVISQFEVKVLTRIGLRFVYIKKFDTFEDASAAIERVSIVPKFAGAMFGATEVPREAIFRWQSKDVGTAFKLAAETINFDAKLPPELGTEEEIHKVHHQLVLDVDTYTVKPVERGQFDAKSWIAHARHVVKRDCERILEGEALVK